MLPGVTLILYGAAASTLRETRSTAESAERKNAGPNSTARTAAVTTLANTAPLTRNGPCSARRGGGTALLDRLLHELFDERRRFPVPSLAARLHRADEHRLQRRLFLLEVEGDLVGGDAAPQRLHEEEIGGPDDRGREHEAREQDGRGREARPLHQVGEREE